MEQKLAPGVPSQADDRGRRDLYRVPAAHFVPGALIFKEKLIYKGKRTRWYFFSLLDDLPPGKGRRVPWDNQKIKISIAVDFKTVLFAWGARTEKEMAQHTIP